MVFVSDDWVLLIRPNPNAKAAVTATVNFFLIVVGVGCLIVVDYLYLKEAYQTFSVMKLRLLSDC